MTQIVEADFVVPVELSDTRFDQVLSEMMPEYSRSRLQQWIKSGAVKVNGEVRKAKEKLRFNDLIEVQVELESQGEWQAQDIPLDIVFEDDEIMVINKPAGLVVHPAAGNPDGTLVNALLAHCGDSLSGIGGVARPGIVHRLDKGTGGLMIAAKNDAAHEGLSKQFADHSLDRAYMALVWGVPNPTRGEIEGNIGRSPQNRKKMAVVKRGGKYALTRYRVLKAFANVVSLVECRLATGRTHQIRVHMTSIGHPLLGDPVYGGGGRSKRVLLNEAARELVDRLDHQALYACELGFMHPRTGKRIHLKSENTKYIKDIVSILERV